MNFLFNKFEKVKFYLYEKSFSNEGNNVSPFHFSGKIKPKSTYSFYAGNWEQVKYEVNNVDYFKYGKCMYFKNRLAISNEGLPLKFYDFDNRDNKYFPKLNNQHIKISTDRGYHYIEHNENPYIYDSGMNGLDDVWRRICEFRGDFTLRITGDFSLIDGDLLKWNW